MTKKDQNFILIVLTVFATYYVGYSQYEKHRDYGEDSKSNGLEQEALFYDYQSHRLIYPEDTVGKVPDFRARRLYSKQEWEEIQSSRGKIERPKVEPDTTDELRRAVENVIEEYMMERNY